MYNSSSVKLGPKVQNNLVKITHPIPSFCGGYLDRFLVLSVSLSQPSAPIIIYEAKGNLGFNVARMCNV